MPSRAARAVIPVAGLGTRLLPATKAVPKELLPIFDRPALELVIAEAVAAGLHEIILVSHRSKRAIRAYFERDRALEAQLERAGKADAAREVRRVAELAHVVEVRQDRPLGLGHAVFAAAAYVNHGPFAVLLPDHLLPVSPLDRLLDAQARHGGATLALQEIEDPRRFGIVEGEDRGGIVHVRRMLEKPSPGATASRLGVIGRYVLPPEILPLLAALRPGTDRELQLTDALVALGDVRGIRIEGPCFDTGSPLGLFEAGVHAALHHPVHGTAARALLLRALA